MTYQALQLLPTPAWMGWILFALGLAAGFAAGIGIGRAWQLVRDANRTINGPRRGWWN